MMKRERGWRVVALSATFDWVLVSKHRLEVRAASAACRATRSKRYLRVLVEVA